MTYVLQEVPQSIAAYFDDENPLGPVAAEHINDKEVGAYLTGIENEAFRDIGQGTALLFGRKGAGKSSLLNTFLLSTQLKGVTQLSLEPTSKGAAFSKDSDFKRSYNLVVAVDASKELDSVHAEVSKHSIMGPELAADHWRRRLWLNVLTATARRPDLIEKLDEDLRVRLIRFSKLTTRIAAVDNVTSYLKEFVSSGDITIESLEILAVELRSAFSKLSLSVLFLIDSIEEYNFSISPALKVTIGGLLYLVGGKKDAGVTYKIAFPYEIYDDIKSEGNTGKINLKSTTLNWRAIDLVKIATKRMLLCLYLYENEEAGRIVASARASQSTSRQVNFQFWESVFGGDIINEAHQPEPALYYVLRHTQMLPRQVILALSWLVRLSKTPRNSFRYIDPDAITAATRQSSTILIGGLEQGFKFTYPDLSASFERYLPHCEIVMNYNELHSVYSQSSVKSGHAYTARFYSFMRALVHVGVFGIVDERSETDRYIEARYCYGDDTVLRGFEGKRFAMHPAFSLFYKEQEQRIALGKAILPRGSVEDIG